jgi:ABC-type amino acid transport substrate-binding protein
MARAAILLALMLLAAAPSAFARDLAAIRASGYLVIGTSGTGAPYTGVDSHNNLVGYDIELGDIIARRLGVAVRWKKIDFRGLMPALAADQVDLVMSAARIRPKLLQTFLFSDPYSYEETVAVTAAADTGVRSLADIRGRTVAVASSTFQEDVAKDVGGYKELLSLPNGTDVFLALHTGHASVGIVGASAAQHYARAHMDPIRIVRAGAPLAPQGIVMQKTALKLKAAIDGLLAERRADGDYAALYRKYLHADPPR